MHVEDLNSLFKQVVYVLPGLPVVFALHSQQTIRKIRQVESKDTGKTKKNRNKIVHTYTPHWSGNFLSHLNFVSAFVLFIYNQP